MTIPSQTWPDETDICFFSCLFLVSLYAGYTFDSTIVVYAHYKPQRTSAGPTMQDMGLCDPSVPDTCQPDNKTSLRFIIFTHPQVS